ncbi:MAG: hypothetical protein IKM43_04155 [Clostridia bacterium]|nr:hypothetical protein [Clostridia bacterium]
MYIKKILNQQLVNFLKENTFFGMSLTKDNTILYDRTNEDEAKLTILNEKDRPKYKIVFSDYECYVEGLCQDNLSKEWRNYVLSLIPQDKKASYKRKANKIIDIKIAELREEYEKEIAELEQGKFTTDDLTC